MLPIAAHAGRQTTAVRRQASTAVRTRTWRVRGPAPCALTVPARSAAGTSPKPYTEPRKQPRCTRVAARRDRTGDGSGGGVGRPEIDTSEL